MAAKEALSLAKAIGSHRDDIEAAWLVLLKEAGGVQTGRIKEAELRTQCSDFLRLLNAAFAQSSEASHAAYAAVREMVASLSRSRALQGFSPSETASFVFSLKQAIFDALSRAASFAPAELAEKTWPINKVLDELALYTMEVFQKSREETIIRQQNEIAELSTPVIRLWQGVLAIPLIGTLDSQRTQIVMENLLQAIVDDSAEIAIIDITGVPTVDTLTAQHLLKTVSAARLMGADCIISGIRPQIAQTIVHLGVELDVVTKATLADALAVALRRIGRAVVAVKPAANPTSLG